MRQKFQKTKQMYKQTYPPNSLHKVHKLLYCDNKLQNIYFLKLPNIRPPPSDVTKTSSDTTVTILTPSDTSIIFE